MYGVMILTRSLVIRYIYYDVIYAGLEADHLNHIRAVWCLAAMFTTVAKKDKEKHPEYYWIEDYCVSMFSFSVPL